MISLAFALLAAAADAPPAPPAAPAFPAIRVIAAPDWAETPTGDQMAAAYPPLAIDWEVTGRAVIECGVQADGTVADCQTIAETPALWGFGAATVAASRYFRLTPQTADGQPVEGARVRIPMRWELGEGQGNPALCERFSVVIAERDTPSRIAALEARLRARGEMAVVDKADVAAAETFVREHRPEADALINACRAQATPGA
jgi:TonB family protein